jgi:hypothetical protein
MKRTGVRRLLAVGITAAAHGVLWVALAACGGTAVDPGPTRTPRPVVPTTTPAPTPVNYLAMRQALLLPLGALIVATRNDSPTRAQHLAAFNAEADKILPVIERDVSPNGNRLHSVIVNVREAAPRRDIASLEAQRMTLLEVR